MSASGTGCKNPKEHRAKWHVVDRNCNYSHFNGRRRTPSAYSAVRCPECPTRWRSKAAYVRTLPDAPPGHGAR